VTNLKFALLTTMPLVTIAGGIAYLWGMRHLERDTEAVIHRIKSNQQKES
jgi:hypothetical protein